MCRIASACVAVLWVPLVRISLACAPYVALGAVVPWLWHTDATSSGRFAGFVIGVSMALSASFAARDVIVVVLKTISAWMCAGMYGCAPCMDVHVLSLLTEPVCCPRCHAMPSRHGPLCVQNFVRSCAHATWACERDVDGSGHHAWCDSSWMVHGPRSVCVTGLRAFATVRHVLSS